MHHVFAGGTNDASTLPEVLADLAERFAVGRICVVADRCVLVDRTGGIFLNERWT